MRAVSNIALAALIFTGAATAAHANVFEIADDGSVRARTGAHAVVWTGGSRDPAMEGSAAEPAPPVPAEAMTTLDTPEAPAMFQAILAEAAKRYDVSSSLLAALVWQESRWRPNALSRKGAIGLGQLMPMTARSLAVDPRDARANLDGAAHYLRQLLDLFDGNVERALAAYNAGPGRVLRANGIPQISETRTYVSSVIDRLTQARPSPRGEY